jgi:hypothetical protein
MPNYAVKDLKTGRKYAAGEWVEVAERPQCDVCLVPALAFYDARASDGRWGYFCLTHFNTLGCRLGMGSGQRLVLEGEVEHITP